MTAEPQHRGLSSPRILTTTQMAELTRPRAPTAAHHQVMAGVVATEAVVVDFRPRWINLGVLGFFCVKYPDRYLRKACISATAIKEAGTAINKRGMPNSMRMVMKSMYASKK